MVRCVIQDRYFGGMLKYQILQLTPTLKHQSIDLET